MNLTKNGHSRKENGISYFLSFQTVIQYYYFVLNKLIS